MIDTNLFLLLLVGRYDSRYLSSFKRTASFTPRDYQLLRTFVGKFQGVVIESHVFAELSNHCFQMPEYRLRIFMNHFVEAIKPLAESHVLKDNILGENVFPKLGVTDTALLISCFTNKYFLITQDWPLTKIAEDHGVDVINFDDIRRHALS